MGQDGILQRVGNPLVEEADCQSAAGYKRPHRSAGSAFDPERGRNIGEFADTFFRQFFQILIVHQVNAALDQLVHGHRHRRIRYALEGDRVRAGRELSATVSSSGRRIVSPE